MEAHPRLDRRLRGAALASAALAALLTVGPPGAALAQDPTAAPSASPAAPAAPTAPTAPEAMPFPTSLAGVDLAVETFSGEQWLAQFQDGNAENEAFAADTEALLEALGKGIDDLSVTSALTEVSPGNQAVIVGLRVAGAEARDFVAPAVDLLLGDVSQPEFVLRPVGSRWVLRVVDAAVPGVYPRTVYLSGDMAWIIGADEEYVFELIEQLPAQTYVEPGGDAVLATQLPVVLDGRRRTGLYEAREPLFLPALELRNGPLLDDWLLDLYMEHGLSPTDLVGTIAWWGVESSQDSVEVEGYQVPGASPELVESLRSRVFLADGQALPDEVSRTEQELAGRQVTTVDFGYATQHILSGDGSVWVVTDHSAEPAMAEEAIAALP